MQNTDNIITAAKDTEHTKKTEREETWNETGNKKWEVKQLQGRFIRMRKDETNEHIWI